ncbi:unnamed protein product [Moneuplotes crassus]|uniref:Protein kinase domain-containing protein n=1 Tax=Euplotes crassus TaxID=5936 RepID=A0AAD1X911_EUPCR|nr:unnamed protein product [Moneuplotes crassus]
MFRKQDFKKVDLLGSSKKNTKIFKAEHLPTGKFFALKEVEAKTIEKLNEYKEEAVQLGKVRNHPNINQTYGYYFYETNYKTFRLAIVIELIDDTTNLEKVYRKRHKKGPYWKEEELEKMIVSLISTLSYLQGIGICHRDIKPSNLFILKSCEIKVIDFGESKDYYADDENGGETDATIRGTPQYLSPTLWQAYMVDKNSRHATHNIYKSDVFSSGLVFLQLALLDDITGCNNPEDGEKAIDLCLKELSKRYSNHIIEILRMMLNFDEKERPSFVELAKQVFTSEDVSMQSKKEEIATREEVKENFPSSTLPRKKRSSREMVNSQNESHHLKEDSNSFGGDMDESSNFLSQSDLFKNYVEVNNLYVNSEPEMFWFEFGGQRIGKLDLKSGPELEEPCTWKLLGKYKYEFSSHFTIVFTDEKHGMYILGGRSNNCLNFKDKNVVCKAKMSEKTFFSAVYLNGLIYTFGGYDSYDKVQLNTCEYYNIEENKWYSNDSVKLTTNRSQSSACILDDETIFIFGGFNKESGTLCSVEKFDVKTNKITSMSLTMPNPLRRFSSIKISTSKILLIGGVERMDKVSDAVYCFDLDTEYRIEKLDRIERGGIVDYPILVDSIGNLHLFLENNYGTSPPFDVVYSFLEYS